MSRAQGEPLQAVYRLVRPIGERSGGWVSLIRCVWRATRANALGSVFFLVVVCCLYIYMYEHIYVYITYCFVFLAVLESE